MLKKKAVNPENTFAFEKVLFFGRTLSEYTQMFNLDLASLKGSAVLDCPSGPASFVFESMSHNIQTVGCDPVYANEPAEIYRRLQNDVSTGCQKQSQVNHLFDKDLDMAKFRQDKLLATKLFVEDYPQGVPEGRYVAGAMPKLPFNDKSFKLALSSNFLFLYSDYKAGGMLVNSPFDYAFHLSALLDLMRIASDEARIYPVKGPHKDNHPYISQIIHDLNSQGFSAQLVPVPYRDIKGAHHMLSVKR